MDKKMFLKPNIVIEPLVEKWYAWTHLISPATAAMNVVGRHMKIMNSYIQSPQIHEVATKNPKMKGGPFMSFSQERKNDVIKLKEDTLQNQSKLFELSDAIKELDALLKKHPKGLSLEPLYEKVPESLRGYVELIYDLNSNPSFRIIEPLLYNSEFYNKSSQSITLWKTNNDERPFSLSTPKLETEGAVHLNIPFDHEGIDALARMKREGGNIEEIIQLLHVKPEETDLFRTFFTEEESPKYERYTGDKARMRYFGHACILIETKDVSILVDPLISYYGYETSISHFSDCDIPDKIDYVLITHNHQDHILFETLLPLRHKIKNIIVPRTTSGTLQDPSLKLMFNNIGFNNVIELAEMENIAFKNCTITGLPFTGEHSDLNILAKLCFHVSIGKFKFLFVADSKVLEPKIYQLVQKIMGDVHVVFLGMECEGAPLSWLYGPLLTEDLPRENDQSRRLSGSDCERGMHLVEAFNPGEVYVYAMGQEPWLEFISSIKYSNESLPIVESNKLIAECHKRNIISERLFGEKELFYNYNL